MSRRAYPLEVQALTADGEEPTGVWSKGHHAAGCELAGDPFLDAARAYLREQCWFDDDELADLPAVAFETWRCVPARLDGEAWSRFCPAAPGTRGAFPVTVLRLDDQDD